MRILHVATIALTLFNSSHAFANNCAANSVDWTVTERNLQWTVFDDAHARNCYYQDGGSAYDRIMDCNDRVKDNANGAKDHFTACWPDNVCNWIRAKGAPGC